MRERRYKYTVWEGPLRQAQGPFSFSTVEQKVQMEELQWGFPIATPLSLNKLTSINGKEKEATHPTQWVGLGTVKKVVEIGEKVKAHGLRSMGLLFLIYEK